MKLLRNFDGIQITNKLSITHTNIEFYVKNSKRKKIQVKKKYHYDNIDIIRGKMLLIHLCVHFGLHKGVLMTKKPSWGA